MRHFILFLIVTAASAADVSVAVPDTLPAAAQAAVDRYTADVAKIHEDAEKIVAKKTADLAKVLLKAQDDATKKGDLQGALAVKAKIAGLPVTTDVLGNADNKAIRNVRATLWSGCDDHFEIYQNGVKVLSGEEFDVAGNAKIMVSSGDVFTVKAVNVKGAYGFNFAIRAESGENLAISDVVNWKSYKPENTAQWFDSKLIKKTDLSDVVVATGSNARGLALTRKNAGGNVAPLTIWGADTETSYLIYIVK